MLRVALAVTALLTLFVDGVVAQDFPVERLFGVGNRRVMPSKDLIGDPTPHPDLPADAREMLAGFNTDAAEIRKKYEAEVHQRRQRLVDELQAAQDRYTREAKLDEAVAIRDTIRRLKAAHLSVRPNPGNLYEFRGQEGQTLYFEVTGRTGYSIWGSDVYTGDSDLATAAVHAGAVRPGETAIVEVQIIPSPPQHVSSARNGVTSSGWGPYPFSYTVRRWAPSAVQK